MKNTKQDYEAARQFIEIIAGSADAIVLRMENRAS